MFDNATQELLDLLNLEKPDNLQVCQKLYEFLGTDPKDHQVLASVIGLLKTKTPDLYEIVHHDVCEHIAGVLVIQEITKHKPNGDYTN